MIGLGLFFLVPTAKWAILLLVLAIGASFWSRKRIAAAELTWREANARLATLALDLAGSKVAAAEVEALQAEHETALMRLSRAARARGRIRGGLGLVVGSSGALAAGLILAGSPPGALLLATWWALRMPALCEDVLNAAAELAALRTVDRRLHELRADRQSSPEAQLQPEPSIRLSGVGLTLGGIEILRDLNLTLPSGAETAIVGPSGAGKSTLGRLLLGLHPPTTGEILWSDPTPDALAFGARSGWVDGHESLPDQRVSELLVPRAHVAERSQALVEALALSEILAALLNAHRDDLEAEALQRLRIARGAGSSDSRLVILDEPFRSLDADQAKRCHQRLRERAPAAAIVHLTHDLEAASRADWLAVLVDGQIVEYGRPEILRANGGLFASALAIEDPLERWPWRPQKGIET